MVAALLQVTGHPALVDTARLLTSELVTNVQLHTDVDELELRAAVWRQQVVVSVTDTRPRGVPRAQPARHPQGEAHPQGEGKHGRDLSLVGTLAHTWGTTWLGGPEPTAKNVWFALHEANGTDSGPGADG